MNKALEWILFSIFIGIWILGFSLSIYRPELLDGFLGAFISYFFGVFIVLYIFFSLGNELFQGRWMRLLGSIFLVALWVLERLIRKGVF